MGRLIDEELLLKKVIESKEDNPHKDVKIKVNHDTEHNHFMYMIADQPTAFDVEAVVKELEEKIAYVKRTMVTEIHDELDRIANNTAEDFIMAYEDAIEIIRKGGVKNG